MPRSQPAPAGEPGIDPPASETDLERLIPADGGMLMRGQQIGALIGSQVVFHRRSIPTGYDTELRKSEPTASRDDGVVNLEEQLSDANRAFYGAFEARDLEAMGHVWERSGRVTVTHPGW